MIKVHAINRRADQWHVPHVVQRQSPAFWQGFRSTLHAPEKKPVDVRQNKK